MDFCKKLEFLSLASLSSASTMYVGKAGANLSEAPFWRSTLGEAPGLTNKH